MGQMYLVFVCHAEPLWWDKDWTNFCYGLKLMDMLLSSAGKATNKTAVATLCPGFYHEQEYMSVAEHRSVLFRRLEHKGHEIGVHTHVDYDEIAEDSDVQDRNIKSDAESLVKNHLARPSTWAAGDWFVTKGTVKALIDAGLTVDCSVAPLFGDIRHKKNGAVIARHSRCQQLKPYEPDINDIFTPGKSGIVELPVSGYLGEFTYKEEDKLDLAEEMINQRFQKRLQELGPNEVDVFQIAWHIFDLFIEEDGRYVANQGLVNNLLAFLVNALPHDNVEVTTAKEAAKAWWERRDITS